MKFIKIDTAFINVDHIKMIGLDMIEEEEGEESSTHMLDICINASSGRQETNITYPLTGLSDSDADEFLHDLFRFFNYKNTPQVFDVGKHMTDVLNHDHFLTEE